MPTERTVDTAIMYAYTQDTQTTWTVFCAVCVGEEGRAWILVGGPVSL